MIISARYPAYDQRVPKFIVIIAENFHVQDDIQSGFTKRRRNNDYDVDLGLVGKKSFTIVPAP